jgi:hypothetical protein
MPWDEALHGKGLVKSATSDVCLGVLHKERRGGGVSCIPSLETAVLSIDKSGELLAKP